MYEAEDKDPFYREVRERYRIAGVVCSILTVMPILVAVLFRDQGASSDYSSEWWSVFAALAISVGSLSVLMPFCSRGIDGEVMAVSAMLCVGIVVMYEAAVGVLQIAGYAPSVNPNFLLTGTFYNPGPYGGYVALGLPVGLSMKLSDKRLQRYFGVVVLMVSLMVLPASESRSAWLAGVVSCGFVAIAQKRERACAWLRHRWLVIIPVAIAFAVGAYLMKVDSADGRLLMWRIGLLACFDHPWGVGWECVGGAYGDAQEAFFASGCATPGEISVAGAPEYLFNEYLQVALAWGWIAALFFIALLVGIIIGAVKARLYGIGGMFVAFGVFAFSSYPLQFPLFVATMIMMGYVVVVALCNSRRRLWCLTGIGVIISLLTGIYAARHYRISDAYGRWKQSRDSYTSADFEGAVVKMSAFGDTLAWNKNFMFELGHALNITGNFRESNRVLAEASKICSDPVIFNIRGKNFQALGMADSALTEFRRAVHRLPNRMYPHFLMVMLAKECEPVDTALLHREAKTVLEMPVKVMSPAVSEMRDSVRMVLSTANYRAYDKP